MRQDSGRADRAPGPGWPRFFPAAMRETVSSALPGAVVQQDRDDAIEHAVAVGVDLVAHGQVEPAVAVEVADHRQPHLDSAAIEREGAGLESAVAIAQVEPDAALHAIRGEVEL